jgi:hypothetical protein
VVLVVVVVVMMVMMVVVVLVTVEVLVVVVVVAQVVIVYSSTAQYRVLASCHSGLQTCNVPQGDGVSHLPNPIFQVSVSVFMTPRYRMAQIYHYAMGSSGPRYVQFPYNNFEPLWVKETRCTFETLGYDPTCCGSTTILSDRRDIVEGLQYRYILKMKI